MSHHIAITFVPLECYFCGTPFGISQQLYDTARRKQGHTFYCPNGHGQIFTETAEAKLAKAREEADRLKKRLADVERWEQEAGARARAAEKSLAATKGQITKLRKRAQAGLCPYCKRHFVALEAHVRCKHKDQALPEESS